jgi:hypothetical protein
MNDFLEFHWGYSIWEKAANEVIKTTGKEFLDKIDIVFHSFGLNGLLTSACFSKNGDVLSQWRAYADDGKGYSIGFKAQDLIKLQIRPLKVLYNEKEQIEELKNRILAVFEVEKSEKKKFSKQFFETCFRIACDLSSYKNPAFIEEQEVRLIHVLNFEQSSIFLKLVDHGGTAFGRKVNGQQVNFRMKGSLPVPFLDLDFTNSNKINPIKEVIVGPKNDAQLTAISVFLETIGIESVNLKKSTASYR